MTNEKCDICGSIVQGERSMGLEISLSGIATDEAIRVKEMFGKTEFKACFCCWLKSIGFKKLKKEE